MCKAGAIVHVCGRVGSGDGPPADGAPLGAVVPAGRVVRGTDRRGRESRDVRRTNSVAPHRPRGRRQHAHHQLQVCVLPCVYILKQSKGLLSGSFSLSPGPSRVRRCVDQIIKDLYNFYLFKCQLFHISSVNAKGFSIL